jgi:hypothetical protein
MTTTPTPARPAAAAPAGAPAPERIGWRRRWMLRRQGRRDGRMRRPDPLQLVGPVGTPMRAVLHAEFADAASRAYAEFTDDAAQRSALELVRVRLPQQRANLVDAEAELAAAEARRGPTGAMPERLMGEHFQPEELVRARRRNEHDHASAAPQRRRDTARAELQQREIHAAAEAERLDALARPAERRLAETEERLAWLHAGADPGRHPRSRRARAVVRVLTGLGVAGTRLTSVGVGTDFVGFVPDTDAQGRLIETIAVQNRLVIIQPAGQQC